MNTIDFVKLAVSKDDARYNLKEIYRAEDKLIAMDGNRLHYVNGMEKVKPHFPSGLDAEFPDYTCVLPKDAPKWKGTFRADKDVIALLEPLTKMAKHINKTEVCSKITFTKESMLIEVTGDLLKTSLAIGFSECDCTEHATIGLNLSYFLDVLKFASKEKRFPLVEVEFYAPERGLILKVPMVKGVALIMPMRLPR